MIISPLSPSLGQAPRRGFTVIEIIVSLSILGVLMIIVAQVGYWSMTHRLECIAKQLALQHANNIMEAARATPYEHLTEQWAADLGLPEESKGFWPDGQLGIKVEREPSIARVKRVTVEISWNSKPSLPAQVVKLVALFAARTEGKK